MNVKGFHYKPLGILGMLEYNVADIATSGTSEGIILATVHIENVQTVPDATKVVVPLWAYPYAFRIHIPIKFLRKARTSALIGVTAKATVEVEFEPY